MLPKQLDINDSDFQWVGGANQVPERQALIATIEIAADIDAHNPAFVELGTFKGIKARNFIIALNKLNRESRFFSVDLNPYIKDPGFQPRVEWEKRCNDIHGVCTQKFLEGKTIDFSSHFDDEQIAWLFIDACHCYDCVSKEIELYAPKIIVGGLILFHDTAKVQDNQWVGHNSPKKYGVLKAIKESKELNSSFEFVHEVRAHHGTQIWRKTCHT